MWFQVELPEAVRLTEIQFESPGQGGRGGGRGRGAAPETPAGAAPAPPPAVTPPAPASPRHYQVVVSMDGATWSAPIAAGEGTGSSTTITFASARARFVRIMQTGAADGGRRDAPRLRIRRTDADET
jgi:hypothetical protein